MRKSPCAIGCPEHVGCAAYVSLMADLFLYGNPFGFCAPSEAKGDCEGGCDCDKKCGTEPAPAPEVKKEPTPGEENVRFFSTPTPIELIEGLWGPDAGNDWDGL